MHLNMAYGSTFFSLSLTSPYHLHSLFSVSTRVPSILWTLKPSTLTQNISMFTTTLSSILYLQTLSQYCGSLLSIWLLISSWNSYCPSYIKSIVHPSVSFDYLRSFFFIFFLLSFFISHLLCSLSLIGVCWTFKLCPSFLSSLTYTSRVCSICIPFWCFSILSRFHQTGHWGCIYCLYQTAFTLTCHTHRVAQEWSSHLLCMKYTVFSTKLDTEDSSPPTS